MLVSCEGLLMICGVVECTECEGARSSEGSKVLISGSSTVGAGERPTNSSKHLATPVTRPIINFCALKLRILQWKICTCWERTIRKEDTLGDDRYRCENNAYVCTTGH